MDYTVLFVAKIRTFHYTSRMTFTGIIGRFCMLPLRAIIQACVALRIHPNILTFVGVLINAAAAWELALGRFVTAASAGGRGWARSAIHPAVSAIEMRTGRTRYFTLQPGVVSAC